MGLYPFRDHLVKIMVLRLGTKTGWQWGKSTENYISRVCFLNKNNLRSLQPRFAARMCWKVTIWLFSLTLNFCTLAKVSSFEIQNDPAKDLKICLWSLNKVFFAGMYQFMSKSVTQNSEDLDLIKKDPCWTNRTGMHLTIRPEIMFDKQLLVNLRNLK